jgi:exopolysaccharide production protein ExoZ
MRTLQSVQCLRAVAALMVVLFHALSRRDVPFGIGAAGVDIFFVISGFIMWTISERETAPGRFLLRRLVRIAPLYWLVTLFMAACAVLAPGKIFPALTVDLNGVLHALAFIPHRDQRGEIFPVLTAGWTLNYEMAFYVLFAACLLLRRAWRLPAMAAVMLALVAAGLAFRPTQPAAVTYTDPLILEFLAGAVLAEVCRRGLAAPPPVAAGLLLLGSAALVAEHLLAVEVSPLARPLVWGVPALAIVAGAVMLEARGRVVEIPLLKVVGDASYSVYLLHGLVVSLLFKLMGGADAVLFCAVAVAVSCLVGYASYRLFERPSGAALRRLTERSKPPRAEARPIPAVDNAA